MTLKTKSALSYFGSDSEVAAELGDMLNHCRHVTIPFCGGLSILPHLSATHVVANDLYADAINFYRVVSGVYGVRQQAELLMRCAATLSHPAEMDDARRLLIEGTDVDRAWAQWCLCWVGRKGKGGTKQQVSAPSVRRTPTGGSNASRIQAAAEDLHKWKRHLARCEFESRDFRELLPRVADRSDCGIYCDPPWVSAGKNYLHSFSEQDHIDLAELLSRFKATTVVVRYDDHPLLRELYASWNIVERSSRTQSNGSVGEIWITNQDISCAASYGDA